MARTDSIGILLGETARAWRCQLDKRLRPLGLSQAKWLALLHLNVGGDGMLQKDLAARLGVEGPTLVGLLDRMSRDGWIERRPCGQDRRSKSVHLTGKAFAVLSEIDATADRLRAELLDGISREDLACAAGVLRRIKDRADSL